MLAFTIFSRALSVLLLTLVLTSQPARAQAATSALDDSLSRLSEILGALHYLRGICDAGEGNRWRNEMQALIDTEGTTPERKARMTAGFNRGFRGFQQTYRTCTNAAGTATRRYLEEGAKLSREVTARYSN
ncbi:MAG TPA: TIGR02301 family protein [Xanthobacteraceae bacterium]|nr:TIGR02301 family protein [Xanthobacteraceae bacterium]